MASPEVVIVGAGLSGLSAALRLQQQGRTSLVLEASDGVGGRVRTDQLNGFMLDRGFQVLLTAYPEAMQLLDYAELKLHAFEPGALVYVAGDFHRVSDPYRQPLRALRSLFAPVGTLSDKLHVASLRRRVMSMPLDRLLAEPSSTTLAALQKEGFSEQMINRFFRPFFGGVFLESELATSNRLFDYLFRMFASGDASLPAGGMGAIPEQLAARLPEGTIRLNAPVRSIHDETVTLENGETYHPNAVIVATDGAAASQLVAQVTAPGWHGVTTLYFAASESPIAEPLLVLNGDGIGMVNNVAVPSLIAPSYAPSGQALVAVSVLGIPRESDPILEGNVRNQLRSWFGSKVGGWRHLRTYRIPRALPAQPPQNGETLEQPVSIDGWRFVCGDHRDTASINGALYSGRRAAEAVIAALAHAPQVTPAPR